MKNSIAIKYGLFLFISLASFFGIIWIFGQADKTWLRFFNAAIHFTVLYFAISAYQKENPQALGNYLSGVGVGMTLTFIGSLLFAIFMAAFVAIDENLAQALNKELPYSFNVLPLSVALFVMVEGIVAGLIGSYIIVRLVNAKLLKNKTGQAQVNQDYETNARMD